MAQISVTNLTYCYEGSFDNIFENVSFSVDTNWKIGFLGRNGKGKTTFLNLLLGKYEYEGTITAPGVFDYFPYVITEQEAAGCASDFLERIKPGCEEWRVICEMGKLACSAELLYRPFCSLSHGERTKVLLAVLFSGDQDFLLIDEPTNHLDVQSREVVKQYLAGKKGFLLVSHDRDILDACVDHVLVLNRKSIEVQSGNFSSWWENKKRRDQFERMENEKHLREIASLRRAADQSSRWAEKNENEKIGFDPIREHDRCLDTRAYIGAKTKKMQARVKQYERRMEREIQEKEGLLQDLEEPVELKLFPLLYHKQRLISCREASLGYGNGRDDVLKQFSFELMQGERVFLHGVNGCGKSTLIKAILDRAGLGEWNVNSKKELIGLQEAQRGKQQIRLQEERQRGLQIESLEVLQDNILQTSRGELSGNAKTYLEEESGVLLSGGELQVGSGLVISYINQDTSFLAGDLREFCRKRGLEESLFFALLRQLDMERVQFTKGIEEFSEGQKKKVLLAASLMTPAHLYIWDEPLNYIDVFSRMQIEELLLRFQPTMLLVDHDVRFRERIATRVVELGTLETGKRNPM